MIPICRKEVKVMKRLASAFCVLGYLCLFVAGAFWGFERVALDSAVYDRIQARLDVYEETGIAPEALPRVTAVLAGYLRGDLASIDIEEEVFGVRQQVFNEREKAHMEDVLGLFRLERVIRTALFLAGPAFLIAAALTARRGLFSLSLGAFKSFVVLLALLGLGAFLLYRSRGFDDLFIAFHRIFFSNDLWLLNPATDAMIRMLPSAFFAAIALQAGQSALGYGVALSAGSQLILLAAGSIIHFTSGRKQTP